MKAIKDVGRGLPDPTKSGGKSLKSIATIAFNVEEEFCPFFTRNGKGAEPVLEWDAIDKRLGRLGRTMAPIRRPILNAGWSVSWTLNCMWPHIFSPADVVALAGWTGQRGVGDAVAIGMGRYVIVEVSEPHEISWT